MVGERIALAVSAAICLAAPIPSFAQDAPSAPAPGPAPAAAASLTLPAGTPLVVVLSDDLSTQANGVGDRFQVAVLNDVTSQGTVVIPSGTIGYGEVTFSTKKGGFGKPGILGIALRYLELNGKSFLLDGRYREEGKDGDGAAGATMFAVGIFAGLVKGKAGVIPRGRQLRARTGEDIAFSLAGPEADRTQTAAPAATEPTAGPATSELPSPGDLQPAAAGSQPLLS